ncbi:hypothetical protein [Shewanella woodyi]|uniref:hypothetical protein n=1 Tax=Shewanella woodyi TaxID=60961 RepID=UPI0007E9CCCE|nr:hypothetical protein [Shewanella woodyi]
MDTSLSNINIVVKIFISVSLFFSVTAHSGDHKIKVCDIQSHSTSNSTYISPCGGWQSKNNCPHNGWITWDMSQFQGQAMYSTALAALLADKYITVRLNGSSCASYDVTQMIRMSKH